MRVRSMTRSLPIRRRSVIPAPSSCIRTRAFKATNRRWGKLGSRKKAVQGTIIAERETVQPGAVAYPACPGAQTPPANMTHPYFAYTLYYLIGRQGVSGERQQVGG